MEYFHSFSRKAKRFILTVLLVSNIAVLALGLSAEHLTKLPYPVILGAASALSILLTIFISRIISNYTLKPLESVAQVILHISPSEHGVAAPNLKELHSGYELTAALAAQIYQLVNVAEHAVAEGRLASTNINNNFIAQNLPLPMLVLDSEEIIVFANKSAADYIGIGAQELIGKNIYMVLDMAFPSPSTFDSWLKQVKNNSATATASWERVKLGVQENHPERLFDLAAFYNRENPQKLETMLVLFDHTKQYSQDEQAVSFIALSVHELRQPLMLLRGYVEALEEELSGKVSAELTNFMLKMRAQTDQLMAYVNNILNVARIDNNQLELELQEGDWYTILKNNLENLSLQAKVRGITLQCHLDNDLPPVAVDRLSIQEVVNNLIDNAIKYSGTSKVINIETRLNGEGLVETTVRDFGVGIPTTAIPNLFTKFYRDHRNRAQVGGTGLGLYLSKVIVEAHGGTLWVRSKEGSGSTFGFTLIPYGRMQTEQKQAENHKLLRTASGWIKNHSLYRR